MRWEQKLELQKFKQIFIQITPEKCSQWQIFALARWSYISAKEYGKVPPENRMMLVARWVPSRAVGSQVPSTACSQEVQELLPPIQASTICPTTTIEIRLSPSSWGFDCDFIFEAADMMSKCLGMFALVVCIWSRHWEGGLNITFVGINGNFGWLCHCVAIQLQMGSF